MLSEDEREHIRRAYFIDHLKVSQIARDTGYCRQTVKNVIEAVPRKSYHLRNGRPSPRFQPFQHRLEELLAENETSPPKQRYTTHKLFEILQAEGYQGCESRIGQFRAEWKQANYLPEVFLPLQFDPGQDAQCDWGEAITIIGGVRQTVQVFVLRLCYSRRVFVMCFPTQQQESFLYAHVQAFKHFGGVPRRISYDNLATAVKLAMDRDKRRKQWIENRTFVSFRSHYLFESHFCTPGQEHEKGSVESSVGFSRRNFLGPIPEVASFEALNQYLLKECRQNDGRRMRGQSLTIGQVGEQEQPLLRPLPEFEYDCSKQITARLTPYSQIVFDTNRYSVPVARARREVTVKAYPFRMEIFDRDHLIASHSRCHERNQDIFDPLHYLPLLKQRPGAFDFAAPMKRWQKDWPECYNRMLRNLREKWPEGRGIQEFVRILQLHERYSPIQMQEAIEQALHYGCIHLDGVLHCLHQVTQQEAHIAPLDLSDRPELDAIGNQSVDLSRYERLLKQSW